MESSRANGAWCRIGADSCDAGYSYDKSSTSDFDFLTVVMLGVLVRERLSKAHYPFWPQNIYVSSGPSRCLGLRCLLEELYASYWPKLLLRGLSLLRYFSYSLQARSRTMLLSWSKSRSHRKTAFLTNHGSVKSRVIRFWTICSRFTTTNSVGLIIDMNNNRLLLNDNLDFPFINGYSCPNLSHDLRIVSLIYTRKLRHLSRQMTRSVTLSSQWLFLD